MAKLLPDIPHQAKLHPKHHRAAPDRCKVHPDTTDDAELRPKHCEVESREDEPCPAASQTLLGRIPISHVVPGAPCSP